MLKEYRKTATIKAEQFDSSAKMARKYNGKINPEYYIFAGEPRFVLPTKEGNMKFDKGDWIATGIDGHHWRIMAINKLTNQVSLLMDGDYKTTEAPLKEVTE